MHETTDSGVARPGTRARRVSESSGSTPPPPLPAAVFGATLREAVRFRRFCDRDMSVLEDIRSGHEELEVCHRVLLDELSRHPRSKRQIVFQDHKLHHIATQARKRARILVDLHADKHGLLAAECAELQDRRARFPRFYRELQAINSYHSGQDRNLNLPRQEGEQQSMGNSLNSDNYDIFADLGIPSSGRELVDFSGEEFFGRFLDMHALFTRYLNLPGSTPDLRYEDFVKRVFFDFSCFPASTKSQRRYRDYVSDLLAYLESFLARTRPLHDHSLWTAEQTRAFDAAWSKGEVRWWEGRTPSIEGAGKASKGDKAEASDTAVTTTAIPDAGAVDVATCKNALQLEKLGLDKLKAELLSRGCKCGGTLADRAERLFLVRNMSKDEIPAKFRAKKKRNKRRQRGAGDGVAAKSAGVTAGLKSVALWRAAAHVGLSLSSEIDDTVRQLQRKHTRTHEEMQRRNGANCTMMSGYGRCSGIPQKHGQRAFRRRGRRREIMYNPRAFPSLMGHPLLAVSIARAEQELQM